MSGFDGPPVPRAEDDTIAVLHVDDDPDLTELVATYLERTDSRLTVTSATNPRDALERLWSGRFEAVIADYVMPDLDGLALLEAVRADDPDIPFVLFTGQGGEAVASEAIDRGVTDYILKDADPETFEVLATRVVEAVDQYRATRRVEHDQAVLASAWDGLGVVDDDGTLSYLNEAAAALVDRPRADLLGRSWTTVLADPDAVSTAALPPTDDQGVWSADLTLARADDTPVSVRLVGARRAEGGAVFVLRAHDRSVPDRD